jgi:hypothetical protein
MGFLRERRGAHRGGHRYRSRDVYSRRSLCGESSAGAESGAQPNPVYATIEGIVLSGKDVTGVFGPKGDIVNQPFKAVFTLDTSVPSKPHQECFNLSTNNFSLTRTPVTKAEKV